jgi:hypothetical protein
VAVRGVAKEGGRGSAAVARVVVVRVVAARAAARAMESMGGAKAGAQAARGDRVVPKAVAVELTAARADRVAPVARAAVVMAVVEMARAVWARVVAVGVAMVAEEAGPGLGLVGRRVWEEAATAPARSERAAVVGTVRVMVAAVREVASTGTVAAAEGLRQEGRVATTAAAELVAVAVSLVAALMVVVEVE